MFTTVLRKASTKKGSWGWHVVFIVFMNSFIFLNKVGKALEDWCSYTNIQRVSLKWDWSLDVGKGRIHAFLMSYYTALNTHLELNRKWSQVYIYSV